MKSSDIIKDIRSRLNLSQTELAEKLGVSFATVNRWEKGHRAPSQIALGNIKRLCADNNIDYSQFEGNSIIISNEVITLYHGSKSGIVGDIVPSSREHCDFGKGFYMGTEKTQPLTLICNYSDAKLYTVNVDLSGLKILDVEVGIDWALLVAYNRGKMDSVKGAAIYNRIDEIDLSKGTIKGYIGVIAKRKAIDLYRKLERQSRQGQVVPQPLDACHEIWFSSVQSLTFFLILIRDPVSM